MSFDPYYEWLNITLGDRPPNYYQLLGLAPFEADHQRIHDAGKEQMAHVRRFQLGQHGAEVIRLARELALAFDCLTTPERKATYDEELRAILDRSAPPPSDFFDDYADGLPDVDTEIDEEDEPPSTASQSMTVHSFTLARDAFSSKAGSRRSPIAHVDIDRRFEWGIVVIGLTTVALIVGICLASFYIAYSD